MKREKVISYLERCREYIPDHSPFRATTLVYIPPAQQLRNQADQIEVDEVFAKELDEFIAELKAETPNPQD